MWTNERASDDERIRIGPGSLRVLHMHQRRFQCRCVLHGVRVHAYCWQVERE